MALGTDQMEVAGSGTTRTALFSGFSRHSGTSHDQWAATLAVDTADPYFFDHPLDHVPGMALVCGLFGLLRAAGGDDPRLRPTGRRLRTVLRFPGFCELDRPVGLTASTPAGRVGDPDVEVTLRAHQGESTVCAGTVAFTAGPPATGPATGRPVTAGAAPADPALVHRRLPGNVLVSEVVPDGGDLVAAVRRPAAGHPLADVATRVELVVDAARQFATMLHHVAHGAAPEDTFVLLDLVAELPGDLSGELELGWTPTPTTRGRQRSTVRVLTDGLPCGQVDFRYHVATPAVYQRLRQPTAASSDTDRDGATAAGRDLAGRTA